MSYDFSLRIPAAQRKRKRKDGPHPEQLQRLQRAREILLDFEPGIVLEEDEGMFTAHSATLGDIFVQADRISLGMSMGAEPRVVYTVIHTVMRLFDGEGYEATDPQVDGNIEYRGDFAAFMQQYRAHFSCDESEFDQWCRGETPPAWAERDAIRARGHEVAARAMPRDWELDWHQQKALSDDALWMHLQEVIRRNDEAIAANGLGDYMQALSYARKHDFPLGGRRVDGSYYPDSMATPWYQGSTLHYEAITLGALVERGYPAAVRDQPQCLTVVFDLPPDAPIDNAWHAMVQGTMAPVHALLQAAGLNRQGSDASACRNRWQFCYYGEDADAMHAALVAFFSEPGRYRPITMTKRYGERGAREVEIEFPARPS
jgi:hypothetical protein